VSDEKSQNLSNAIKNGEVSADGKSFTPEFMQKVKAVGLETLSVAMKAAEGFRMPLVAVFVFDNDSGLAATDNAFSAVNCPLYIADAMLHAGMEILSREQEKREGAGVLQ
jgi:hypothetical protein